MELSEYHILNLKKVKKYIDENIDSNKTLSQLALFAGLNEFILKKGFKQMYDQTVFTYWNNEKMRRAKEQLKNSDISIKAIAINLGFKDSRYFSTAFKRTFGIRPSEYRKNKNQSC